MVALFNPQLTHVMLSYLLDKTSNTSTRTRQSQDKDPITPIHTLSSPLDFVLSTAATCICTTLARRNEATRLPRWLAFFATPWPNMRS